AAHRDADHVPGRAEVRRGGGEQVGSPAGVQRPLSEHAIVQCDAEPAAAAGPSLAVDAWPQDEAELADGRVDMPEPDLSRRRQKPHTMVLRIRSVQRPGTTEQASSVRRVEVDPGHGNTPAGQRPGWDGDRDTVARC